MLHTVVKHRNEPSSSSSPSMNVKVMKNLVARVKSSKLVAAVSGTPTAVRADAAANSNPAEMEALRPYLSQMKVAKM